MNKFKMFLIACSVLLISFANVSEASAEECVYYDRGWCVPGWIDLDTWLIPMPTGVEVLGSVVWYDPYVMEATAAYRGMDCRGFIGCVSLMSPSDIGKIVWINRGTDDGWIGPFLVADSSQRNHMFVTVTQLGEVVEVDYETAKRWKMVTNGGKTVYHWSFRDVRISVGLLSPDEGLEVLEYASWYADRLEYGAWAYYRWGMPEPQIRNWDDYTHALARVEKMERLRMTIFDESDMRIDEWAHRVWLSVK